MSRPTPDVFDPGTLGPVTLRNRIIKAATFEARTPAGAVTDELIEYHRAPAAGGVGMTTVAYCAVSPEGRTERDQILMTPEAVPALVRLTDAVRSEGAAVCAQLGHAGPVANAASNGLPAFSPSRMFSPLAMKATRQPDAAEIARIVADHARAADLAGQAGFDAVELHFGHNYLVSSFFSPLLNRRRDSYGGSLANRARLAREIAVAVRESVGDQIAVTAKLNMDDGVPGGLRLEESLQIGRWLQDDGALDALQLTVGSSLLNPMYYFRGQAPRDDFARVFPRPLNWALLTAGRFFLRQYPFEEAYLLESARQFRHELSMPLILLGGITTRDTMDQAMAEGFEYVAMARALLRDPGLVGRIRSDPTTRSLCTHCNKCMVTIFEKTRCVLHPLPAADNPSAERAAVHAELFA
ncbi:NADH:flavin oxidoreductase [Mycolicibacterium vanbaalenii]|uniref:NADH:flavin oxidoreductase/NADH oxidase n=1 Tax=Mycolicibacterium vanbaalenii (strain DSM 7251 / JCM 13017 / BCRC 16820 / KCTC 9966 / NRRL B-24157 / PYR-1) TaxID=350058 RepID=A1T937_MYCVP|nr:NADH:flavin oxidoreductase [Mycolicibacterium vanbaalenii]ABM13687.1 NADH:flavin oxidoreductase/NADH oxidase [Mycolicibacterium vanbaalenii PYR-1]MCV7126575.1 NADH:flavin oxidoreductase [Mycolicibacterium vanbaalenii PYR-1]